MSKNCCLVATNEGPFACFSHFSVIFNSATVPRRVLRLVYSIHANIEFFVNIGFIWHFNTCTVHNITLVMKSLRRDYGTD